MLLKDSAFVLIHCVYYSKNLFKYGSDGAWKYSLITYNSKYEVMKHQLIPSYNLRIRESIFASFNLFSSYILRIFV